MNSTFAITMPEILLPQIIYGSYISGIVMAKLHAVQT